MDEVEDGCWQRIVYQIFFNSLPCSWHSHSCANVHQTEIQSGFAEYIHTSSRVENVVVHSHSKITLALLLTVGSQLGVCELFIGVSSKLDPSPVGDEHDPWAANPTLNKMYSSTITEVDLFGKDGT
jgi:hypothetical protein